MLWGIFKTSKKEKYRCHKGAIAIFWDLSSKGILRCSLCYNLFKLSWMFYLLLLSRWYLTHSKAHCCSHLHHHPLSQLHAPLQTLKTCIVLLHAENIWHLYNDGVSYCISADSIPMSPVQYYDSSVSRSCASSSAHYRSNQRWLSCPVEKISPDSLQLR